MTSISTAVRKAALNWVSYQLTSCIAVRLCYLVGVLCTLAASSTGTSLAHEPQHAARLFFISEQATVTKDPLGDIAVEMEREQLRPIEDFVRMIRRQSADGMVAESSDERSLDRLKRHGAKLLDARAIAWSTAINPHAYPQHGRSYQCLVMCWYASEASDQPIAVVCQISSPTGNAHTEWMIGATGVPFLKPVLIVDWPPREEQLVAYLSGTNFGFRNFLLDRNSICIVTSYFPKYERWNQQLKVELEEVERAKLYQDYVHAIGRPIREP